jgi:transcriptional regulator with XRE-family HTH domain
MPRSRKSSGTPVENTQWADLNEIVAYNFRAARELRGMTQDDIAARLEPILGQRLPQASISAIERAYQGERRREFDAHELLAFSLAFDLPLVWFFLPPPDDGRKLRGTSSYVEELYAIAFGSDRNVSAIYDRLRDLGHREPSAHDQAIENIFGQPSEARRESYRERRKEMLLALVDKEADRLDKAADEFGSFFDHLRQVGIRGFVAEHLNDDDFTERQDDEGKKN